MPASSVKQGVTVVCESCGTGCQGGELLIPFTGMDDDDTELEHEGPYFWNRRNR